MTLPVNMDLVFLANGEEGNVYIVLRRVGGVLGGNSRLGENS